MAGDKRGAGTPKSPGGKRRRPQPTIELTAREIPSEPTATSASGSEAPDSAQSTATSPVDAPPSAEAAAAASAAASSGSDAPPPADTATSAVAPAPPATEAAVAPDAAAPDRGPDFDTPRAPEAARAASPDEPAVPMQPTAQTPVSASERIEASPAMSAAEPPPKEIDEERAEAPRPPRAAAATPWTTVATGWIDERIAQSPPLASAAVGAAVAALIAIGVIAGLWKTGVMAAHDERLPSLAARVGELERQLRQFAARPALASDERIAAIGQRVFENEHVLTNVNYRLLQTEAQLRIGSISEEAALPQVKELHRRLAAEFGHIIDVRMAGILNADRAQVKDIGERMAKFEEAARATGSGPAGPPAKTDEAPAATAAVLAQVRELEKRLASTDETLRAIRERAPEPRPAGRPAAVDGAFKSLTDAAAALRQRVDEVAGLAQAANDAATQSSGTFSARAAEIAGVVDGVSKRTAVLEDSLKGLQAAVSRPQAPDNDRAARFAVAALALRAAVERGDAFAAELAAVKPLVPDQASLAPLEPFAATGVPGTGVLARELSSLAATVRKASEQEPQGGLLDRLQAGAGKLVRIKPIDAPAAADAGDAVARVEVQTARGDLAGAVAAAAQLPAAERTAFDPWIKKAQGRMAAVDQAGQLAGAALDGLGKTR
jgi:hypothetical protein